MTDLELIREALFPATDWADALGDLGAEGHCPACHVEGEFSVNIAEPVDIARCADCGYEAPGHVWVSADNQTFYVWMLAP